MGEFGEICSLDEALVGIKLVRLASSGISDGDGVFVSNVFRNDIQTIHKIYIILMSY